MKRSNGWWFVYAMLVPATLGGFLAGWQRASAVDVCHEQEGETSQRTSRRIPPLADRLVTPAREKVATFYGSSGWYA